MTTLKPIKLQRKTTEKDIEQYLCRRVKEAGGVAYKWASANVRGVPDRVCVFPDGRVYFVEVKGPHGKLTALQNRFFERMQELRFNRWRVVWSKEDVDKWIWNMGL